MNRLLVCCVFAGLLLGCSSQKQKLDRPNIILVMTDDLGWADVGYNGNEIVKTPHLDSMAAAGLRFDRFYAAAPVCSPTRGSVLTGRHPYRYGVFNANVGHLPDEEITLAELLKEAGYTTGFFGKWHLGTLTRLEKDSNRGGPEGVSHYAPPWEHGFDVAFATEAKVPTWDPMVKPRDIDRHTWWDPVADSAEGVRYGTAYWDGEEARVTDNLDGDDSRVIVDRALPFIHEATATGTPFFAVIWLHAPHLPVSAGDAYTQPYSHLDDYEQHYFGTVTALDEQIRRLRQALREQGVADNTMIWFNSDNGPEGQVGQAPGSAGPLSGRKRSLREGGIRVPGLLEWPVQVAAGQATSVPVHTSDILPTVLDVLGLDLPDGRPYDGISLVPLLEREMTQRTAPILFESSGQLALIEGNYKILYVPEGRVPPGPRTEPEVPFMLFDLEADPAESRDLATQFPARLDAMQATLHTWRQSVQASLDGADYR